MSLNFLRNIVFIIVLLLAQTLLLNHISVFGCATPLLYVYFALTVQRGEAKWATLLWCFFMGLLVDIFTNTPGVAAASMTLVGFLQPYVVELFAPRDSADDLRPPSPSAQANTPITPSSSYSSIASHSSRSKPSICTTGDNGLLASWQAPSSPLY